MAGSNASGGALAAELVENRKTRSISGLHAGVRREGLGALQEPAQEKGVQGRERGPSLGPGGAPGVQPSLFLWPKKAWGRGYNKSQQSCPQFAKTKYTQFRWEKKMQIKASLPIQSYSMPIKAHLCVCVCLCTCMCKPRHTHTHRHHSVQLFSCLRLTQMIKRDLVPYLAHSRHSVNVCLGGLNLRWECLQHRESASNGQHSEWHPRGKSLQARVGCSAPPVHRA